MSTKQRADCVRRILNEKMDLNHPLRRREIYELVYSALNREERDTLMLGTPDKIQLPRKWQTSVSYVLKRDDAIHEEGGYFTRVKVLSYRGKK